MCPRGWGGPTRTRKRPLCQQMPPRLHPTREAEPWLSASAAHLGSTASCPPEGPWLPQNGRISSDQPTRCARTGPRLEGRALTHAGPTQPPPRPSSGTPPTRVSARSSTWSPCGPRAPRSGPRPGVQGPTIWPRPRAAASPPCPFQRGERPYRFDDGGLTLLPLLAAWSFDLKFTKRRCRENEVGREGKARCQPSGNSLPRQGRPQQPPQAQGSEASKAAPTVP